MILIVWMCWCLSDIQAVETTVSQTTEYNGWSVILSDVVVMSAMTRAAVKRCLEFEPGLVFQFVESKVKLVFGYF